MSRRHWKSWDSVIAWITIRDNSQADKSSEVSIARAIVTDPTLIVADEPTGDLDAKSAAEILNLMNRLNTEFEKTIVMVAHYPNAAARETNIAS